MRGDVDHEVAHLEALLRRGGFGGAGAGAPQDRAHAREQLAGVEGLRHVIVGADVEAGDAVRVLAARREHDDGDVVSSADAAAHLEAVDARKHDVEEDDVCLLYTSRCV